MENELESLKNSIQGNAHESNEQISGIFDSGITKMSFALTMFNASSVHLNNASGLVFTLGTQLNVDYRQKIEMIKQKEDELARKRAEERSMWSTLDPVKSIVLLVLHESDTSPKLTYEYDRVKEDKKRLERQVNLVDNTIDRTKEQIRRELVDLGDMRSDIKNAERFSKWPRTFREKIETKVTSLIRQCKAYKKEYDIMKSIKQMMIEYTPISYPISH